MMWSAEKFVKQSKYSTWNINCPQLQILHIKLVQTMKEFHSEFYYKRWLGYILMPRTVYTSNTVYTILLTFADGLGFWVYPPPKDSENFDTNIRRTMPLMFLWLGGEKKTVFLIELNKDTWNAKLIKTLWKRISFTGGFHISKVFNDVCLKCKWFAQKAVLNKKFISKWHFDLCKTLDDFSKNQILPNFSTKS